MDGKVLRIERRRRWSKDEKARIVKKTLMPGAGGAKSPVGRAWRRGWSPYGESLRARRGPPALRLDLACGQDRRDGAAAAAGFTVAAAAQSDQQSTHAQLVQHQAEAALDAQLKGMKTSLRLTADRGKDWGPFIAASSRAAGRRPQRRRS
jgi:transposase-like protein